jgi:hypothetical protein
MANSFTQRFLMTMMAGFAAACMLFFYRHVVAQAIWETGVGWRDSTFGPTTKH